MKIGFSIVICLIVYTVKAQPTNIASDRPGNAYTSSTVGNAVLQFQNGIDYNRFRFDNNFPEPTKYTNRTLIQSNFIRYGLGLKNEINAAIDYSNIETDQSKSEKTISGISKLGIAYRRNITEEAFGNSSIGVLAQANFNDLLNDFRFSNPDAFLLLLTQTPLTNVFAITTNLGFDLVDDIDKSGLKSNFLYTLNLGFGLTDKLSGYLETYGSYSNGKNTMYYDGGIAYLINSNVQLDLFGGFSVEQLSIEYFVSTGVSWRIGKLLESY